ncbi:MAG: histidine phosphatase family protein [Firmicutes bacterium]|nr:histidine phosphatase family protein [Bacillota bacterium]
MNIIFIRHFATKGNIEKRYVGTTDEEVVSFIEHEYPHCEIVFSSPLKRCCQTAEHIYGTGFFVNENLKEIDFGDFEYKNFDDLKGDTMYEAWLKSGGKANFPKGESVENFQNRTQTAFCECLRKAKRVGAKNVAFVVHGGSIMAVLSRFLKRDFHDFHVQNGCGYVCRFEKNVLTITGEINV